jgi:membrane protein
MRNVERIKRLVKRDVWTADLEGMPVLQRVAVQLVRLSYAVALEFRHRLLDARAAGLVYTTILSLVPLLAVMFSVLKGFGAHHLIEPMLAQILEPLGENAQEITSRVIGFVDNLKVGVLGIVGVAGLFYTAYSLIDKIERALNAIWRVRRGRPWARKFTDYLSVILVGPVLVVAALGMMASIQSHAVVQRVLDIQPLGSLLILAARLIPFFLLCGVFTFAYKFIPYTEVRAISAFVGGIAAAILWGLAGEAFTLFVAQSAKYSAIYSGFAVLILFLLWLYAGWMIVLIGAQVAYFHQHPAAYQPHLLWQQGTQPFRERLALDMLLSLTRRNLQGNGPLRSSELAAELDIPVSLVEEEVDQLVQAGLMGRVAEPEGLSLIKPPELISVMAVLDAVRERSGSGDAAPPPVAGDPVAEVLRRRDEAVEQALAGQTLRTLALEQIPTARPRRTPASA